MLNYNIILCGFMGCGKSTIGKKLAKRLEIPFVDTDKYIEKQNGKKVTKIFSEDGEAYFRKIEKEACIALSQEAPCVIAIGGGTLLDADNADILSKNGRIILIDVPPAILKKRLAHDKKRPLLAADNKNEIIDQLYAERIPIYKSHARVIVDGTSTINSVVTRIIVTLGLRIQKEDKFEKIAD